jgi:hypothetical protein
VAHLDEILKRAQLVFYFICAAFYFRSPGHGKFIKLMTVFFRACGLPAKVFDALHGLGVAFSQNWVLNTTEVISNESYISMIHDVAHHACFGSSDNINIAYKVGEQRLDNQDHFESGSAATIYILKHIDQLPPELAEVRRQQKLAGRKTPLQWPDLVALETEASLKIYEYHKHLVLQIMVDTPEFGFECYEWRDSAVFKPPAPVMQLSVGKNHRTQQYVLPVLQGEVASQQGTERATIWQLEYVFLGALKDQDHRKAIALLTVIVWTGDQLTIQRLRYIIMHRAGEYNEWDRLGMLEPLLAWLHTRMNCGNNIHKQYYGDDREGDFGLAHLFQFLGRRKLHTPSTQGIFYHTLDEALTHILHSLVRALWLHVSGEKSLSALHTLSPQELCSLAGKIIDEHASNKPLAFLKGLHSSKTDHLRQKTVMMFRDLLDWVMLGQVIKTGDVGMMKHMLPRLLFRFEGGGSSNYTTEIVEVIQGFVHEWTPEFQ